MLTNYTIIQLYGLFQVHSELLQLMIRDGLLRTIVHKTDQKNNEPINNISRERNDIPSDKSQRVWRSLSLKIIIRTHTNFILAVKVYRIIPA